MTVERLEIRRDALVVAHLQRAKKGLWVTYTPEVLDTVATGTPVLSCSLPVRSTRLEASAWARGLLPEGQHLNDLAAAADVAASDTFGMLARYGRDIAGAFEIVTEGADPRIPGYDLYLTDELHAEVAGLATTPLAVHDDSELSLPGLQDKMVAVRVGSDWGRPVHGYPSTHIFKVDPLDKPGIVDAEAACLRLARAVDLTDIDVERARFGGRETIIVSRFDRIERDDGTLGRLHQEDLLQALGVHPDSAKRRAKYQAVGTSGPPSWWHAADLLDSYALDADTQLRQLVRIVTYTTAIANADCHAKNIAFLVDDGRIRLAPLYDTVPTALWPELRSTAALTVNDVSPMRSITVDDIAAEARRWGLPFDAAHTEAAGLLEALLDQVQHADHDEVAALVATNTRRLLDQTAR
jgi:serine/threonine-protein kinase HipA